jgi:uncharacterized protein (TIGR03790 family)
MAFSGDRPAAGLGPARGGATPLARGSWPFLIQTCLICLLAVPCATAQTGRHVLVIVNAASPASVEIGEYYARVREVPPDQILRLTLPVEDEISRQQYQALVEQPMASWFLKSGAQDRILYLVLTKGVPLRVTGSSGLQGTVASVDSELTLLYRRMADRHVPVAGRIDNPYYLGAHGLETATPFSHEKHDIYLVSRLDGFTVDEVLRLIDRGKAPVSRGSFVLDMRAALFDRANAWLQTAADRLAARGYKDRVLLDTGSQVITDQQNVLGYYSWGSNDPANRRRSYGFTFAPGALAAMFVSTDGRTFTAPPETWQIGTWEKKETFFAASPQSLAGDLIRAGVTGVAGHVAEPYLDATIRPEILFPAYVAGFNLIESYYLGMPFLSWQTVVVGDPLCAPFPRTEPSSTALDPPTDPVSELPKLFAARWHENLMARWPDVKPEAVRLLQRAQRRLARQDMAGARQALVEATAVDGSFAAAHMALASILERAGEHGKAVDRYRQVLVRAPNEIVALNNLAYSLAVHQKNPTEAIPIAERAYTLSSGAPMIADTLGWVFHLAGDRSQALKYVQQAVHGLPKHGEIRYHYAAVLAAAGDRTAASKELAMALNLDPQLKTRDEVMAFQRNLAALP